MLNLYARCTAREKEYKRIYASKAIQELNKKWAPMYKDLSIWTGQPNFKDFEDGDYIYDAFYHQRMLIKDFKYPEWANETVQKELKEMKLTKFRMNSMTQEMRRIKLGAFFYELKQRVSKALLPSPKKMQYEDTDDTGEVKKLYVYSTHDVFLFNLLANLGTPIDEVPPFGAAVIFELYTDVTANLTLDESLSSSIVQLWYLNETLSENYLDFRANPLQLGGYPGDRTNYTAAEFLSSFSELLLTEAEAQRGCEEMPEEASPSTYITVIVIESIVIALFVGLSVKRCLSN